MAENIRTVEHATCTFCGCVCDDMNLTVDLDKHCITKAEHACVLGKAWFAEHRLKTRAAATIDGREAGVDEAGGEAPRILVNAAFPITYVLSDRTCEAKREALA